MDYLRLLSIVSILNPSRAISFLGQYLGCNEISKDEMALVTKTVYKKWINDFQIEDEEIELLRELVCHIIINSQMSSLQLNENDRKQLLEVIRIILGFIETSSLLIDSPVTTNPLGEQMIRFCESALEKKALTQPSVDLRQYLSMYSLRTDNGGILVFCSRKCLLSLSDLPSYVYQRVNEYLLAKPSFSYVSFL